MSTDPITQLAAATAQKINAQCHTYASRDYWELLQKSGMVAFDEKACEEIVAAALREQREQAWISTDGQLPPANWKQVLVRDSRGEFDVARRLHHPDEWLIDNRDDADSRWPIGHFTHWREIDSIAAGAATAACPTCGSPEKDKCIGFCPDKWHPDDGTLTNGTTVTAEPTSVAPQKENGNDIR